MDVVINGTGIAGPALAYWLLRGGNKVTLVEQAPQIRSGGYIIDFWGIGYDVAEKMGLIPRIRELGYQVEEVRFVDDRGKRVGGFATDVFERMTGGRFTSLRRSDVSATMFKAIESDVDTIFGDSVSTIEEADDRLFVSFAHAEPIEADVLIGADGLHSKIREIAFGDEQQYEKQLGYHVSAFEAAGYQPRDELKYVSYGLPGRQLSRFSMRDDRTLFLFVFRDEYLSGELTASDDQKAALKSIFADGKWECPQILDRLDACDDLYFDRVSQIRMPSWTKGRVALIGDAAACVSLLAGEGTGLAIAEGYVLGNELNRCDGDFRRAFARYESLLMPFLEKKQGSAASFASSFAPKTALGLEFRNLITYLLRIPFVADYFIGNDLRDDIALPDYEN